MITEKHCCKDCQSRISIPKDFEFKKWECICVKKRKEVNPDGGLTDCPEWSERK